MDPVYVICFIYCYDVWFYISHVILHKYLYKIHKIHHSADYKTITYKDTYVAHYFESPFQCLGFLVPLIYIDQKPIHIFCSAFLIILRGLLRHDHRFVWLIGNHHILHHKYHNYNFGEYWLDRGFGTHYPHKEECIYGYITI